MQTQNPLITEIILGVVAVPMAIASPVLLYLGTINLGGALTIWGIAAGLVVGKLALNAPSLAQQQQIGTLQAQQNVQATNLQGLVQYALGLFQSLQAPVASPQAQQAAQPMMPGTSDPAMTPTVNPAPGTALHTLINQAETATTSTLTTPQQQFKTPTPVVVEHPPIRVEDIVNTFPEIPVVPSSQSGQAQP